MSASDLIAPLETKKKKKEFLYFSVSQFCDDETLNEVDPIDSATRPIDVNCLFLGYNVVLNINQVNSFSFFLKMTRNSQRSKFLFISKLFSYLFLWVNNIFLFFFFFLFFVDSQSSLFFFTQSLFFILKFKRRLLVPLGQFLFSTVLFLFCVCEKRERQDETVWSRVNRRTKVPSRVGCQFCSLPPIRHIRLAVRSLALLPLPFPPPPLLYSNKLMLNCSVSSSEISFSFFLATPHTTHFFCCFLPIVFTILNRKFKL